jgi:hypothetical protein
MFGIETEYFLSAFRRDGARTDQHRALARFMDVARRTLVHLPDGRADGMFLQNGSRFYVDTGRHPELATCEVVNPWDSCRYVLAGERILASLAEQAAVEEPSLGEILLARCNVCYSPDRATTWGCHESYAHRVSPAELRDQLIPHLVSRIIYTGAGGFNNRSPGIHFTISPRVPHLENVASDASTRSRGIYHNKDEPLSSNGYHRLHVLCGESVCSQTSLWLKTAVTTLVVAMIEAGLEPCAAIRLRDPLAAMKRFAVDLEMTATAESIDGRPWTALGMQRHILQQIETHAGHSIMPSWTPQVLERLRHVLDRLEQGSGAVATILDWAIKFALYKEFVQHQGISWESLNHWNEVFARHRPLEPPAAPLELEWRTLRTFLDRARTVTDDTLKVVVLPEEKEIDREQLSAVLSLRQELFALDTRFGQLGPRSVFAALDKAGVLEHIVPGVENIEDAVLNPPAIGRARLRGECVRRFHRQRDRFNCDWMAVWDCQQDKYLDLSDPFATEEHWRQARERQPDATRSVTEALPS